VALLWVPLDPHPILTGESETLTSFDHRIFLIRLAIANYHADCRFDIRNRS
jgi:hypothetical protein